MRRGCCGESCSCAMSFNIGNGILCPDLAGDGIWRYVTAVSVTDSNGIHTLALASSRTQFQSPVIWFSTSYGRTSPVSKVGWCTGTCDYVTTSSWYYYVFDSDGLHQYAYQGQCYCQPTDTYIPFYALPPTGLPHANILSSSTWNVVSDIKVTQDIVVNGSYYGLLPPPVPTATATITTISTSTDVVIPVLIPYQELSCTWTTGSTSGSFPLRALQVNSSSSNGYFQSDDCVGEISNLTVRLNQPGGILRITRWFDCPNVNRGTPSCQSNANPPNLVVLDSISNAPVDLLYTVDSLSCPVLSDLGYTSFRITSSNANVESLHCAHFFLSTNMCVFAVGATARIYDSPGGTLLAEGTTDSNGVVDLYWNGGTCTFYYVLSYSGRTSPDITGSYAESSGEFPFISKVFCCELPETLSVTVRCNSGDSTVELNLLHNGHECNSPFWEKEPPYTFGITGFSCLPGLSTITGVGTGCNYPPTVMTINPFHCEFRSASPENCISSMGTCAPVYIDE